MSHPDDDFDPASIAEEYDTMQFLEWVETGIRNGWLDVTGVPE
jgi:hypothetical protein